LRLVFFHRENIIALSFQNLGDQPSLRVQRIGYEGT
jgi:hypothetical protein